MNNLLENYQRDGVVLPIRLLSEGEAAQALANYVTFQQKANELFGHDISIKPHLVAPWVMQLARNESLLNTVSQLIGPNIMLWCSDFFVKKAGTGKHVGFHQDSKYWGLQPSDGVLSAWLALSHSNLDNGCMQVVRGTHTGGVYEHIDTYNPDNMLTVGQEVQHQWADEDVIDVVLKPGEMSIHHLDLIHGGKPNHSDHDRVGLVLRFITPQTRQILGADSAMLICGEDTYQNFDDEQAPLQEWGETELAQLQLVFDEKVSGFSGQIIG
jgi:ectoine hydroxylase-related dioxygenase (phytanoyl-CoA dioxygenase family)